MIVRTRLAEQAEQFELDGVHYVGRRVLCEDAGPFSEVKQAFSMKDESGQLTGCVTVLFRLDDDRGLVFVDPVMLKPYQRPERSAS